MLHGVTFHASRNASTGVNLMYSTTDVKRRLLCNIVLSHRFLMSVLAMLIVWPMINCSTGQKLAHIHNVKWTQKEYINLRTQQFELLKWKCKTVVVITHFVTGQCKSVCHHMCMRKPKTGKGQDSKNAMIKD